MEKKLQSVWNIELLLRRKRWVWRASRVDARGGKWIQGSYATRDEADADAGRWCQRQENK
jgi:hypothetical protein